MNGDQVRLNAVQVAAGLGSERITEPPAFATQLQSAARYMLWLRLTQSDSSYNQG